MNTHGDLITNLKVGKIHQGSIEHQALGIPNLCDRLGHNVKLCFTWLPSQDFASRSQSQGNGMRVLP
jgi:hypothetical protein